MNTESTPIRIQPVILCGGSGTRLWPLSRSGFPKQFLCLTGEHSLFQQAVLRLNSLADSRWQLGAPYVVTSEAHRFLVQEQLRELAVPLGLALLEPEAKNTAPALTLAALAALEQGDDPILVVTPADQTLSDQAAFHQALSQAMALAADGLIGLLGIPPQGPETGYGYIQTVTDETNGISQVARFVEKPSAAAAEGYLQQGGYYWNAGIFVLRASVWLDALRQQRPEMAQIAQLAWQGRRSEGQFLRPEAQAFARVSAESVDYAVLEPLSAEADHPLRLTPLDAGWNDLGAWDAVWKVLPKDEADNALLGDVLLTQSRGNLVHASSRLVSLVGVDDLVVVETADAVLVAHKTQAQQVRQIVDQLGAQSREEQALHRKIYRPWGWYDCIDQGHRFKVKRIQVKPKASLSLQMHHHRAEHWVVVKGTAQIHCGDKSLLISENQSTYIPLGEAHRLSNPGSIPLEIIEVQSGSYLGEDDILRFEDHYGRQDRGSPLEAPSAGSEGQSPGQPPDLLL
ncbi:mannose-1-phosphate guanylyltransferase/mannose-6-phosphate isomerase [Magnetovirga frankeli]|uniref:mannose-1-phosphate guanylyltransferase/mannose-6-phosphate isomerase n=1 Tax=Magnetovirga frankeli TaxID=947516 RepID=UPI001293A11B|nr:mannose-1-phosphate guanylyltransferase/mannose-6-phosphate isomerase [gamma proteobacterium SS-5]